MKRLNFVAALTSISNEILKPKYHLHLRRTIAVFYSLLPLYTKSKFSKNGGQKTFIVH